MPRCTIETPKASRNFLFDLGISNGPLRTIVVKWDIRASEEEENLFFVLAYSLVQPKRLFLLFGRGC